MNVTVRYFANMRDQMGKVSAKQALPSNILIAVNMEYTDSSRVLKNGDEVAFFPPVTGG